MVESTAAMTVPPAAEALRNPGAKQHLSEHLQTDVKVKRDNL